MNSAPCFLGVDLGGTQMRMAVVTGEGRLATELVSVPTGKGFGPDHLRKGLRDLRHRLQPSLDSRTGLALGFGTAGIVDRGPLTQCNNLPLLNGTDLGKLLREVVTGGAGSAGDRGHVDLLPAVGLDVDPPRGHRAPGDRAGGGHRGR